MYVYMYMCMYAYKKKNPETKQIFTDLKEKIRAHGAGLARRVATEKRTQCPYNHDPSTPWI